MCRIERFLFDNNVGEFTVVVFQTEIVFIGEVVNQGILAQKIIYKGYMKETNEIKGSSDFSVQIILQCIDSVIECCLNDGLYKNDILHDLQHSFPFHDQCNSTSFSGFLQRTKNPNTFSFCTFTRLALVA